MTTKRKNKKGRPCKLTKKLQDELCEHIQEGNYLDTACRIVGIDYATMRRWILRGEEEGQGKFYNFCEAIKRAEALAEAWRVKQIKKASYEDWKANAWYLERKYPQRWGKKDSLEAQIKSEHTHREEQAIEHTVKTDQETVELVRQLWRREQALLESEMD
jgi:transposase